MSTHAVARRAALAALILPVALAVGCGGPKFGEVSGKITVRGKAPNLDGLTISFLGADGRTAAAMVGTDGTFSTRGVPAGEVKIALVYQSPQASTKMSSKPTGGGKDVDTETVKKWEASMRAAMDGNAGLPDKLRDPNTSGLIMTVEPNKMNEFNHDVK
jgi:hypothetical protein